MRIALTAILTVSTPWLMPAAAPPQEARLRVTPETVNMGAFYGGTTVRVEGVTGLDEKVVIVVRGGKVTEVFNKVGRVGPIWVNTGKVTISGVPSLLLVFSSEPLNACLTRAAIDQYGLDLPALKKQMRIESKTTDYGRIADEYFLYKTKQGSYHLVTGGIRMNQADKDGLPYTLEFVLLALNSECLELMAGLQEDLQYVPPLRGVLGGRVASIFEKVQGIVESLGKMTGTTYPVLAQALKEQQQEVESYIGIRQERASAWAISSGKATRVLAPGSWSLRRAVRRGCRQGSESTSAATVQLTKPR